jgi:anti-sigma regulatory factor (Ser/Thr protein kinase)
MSAIMVRVPLRFQSDATGFSFSFSDVSLAFQVRRMLVFYLQGQARASSDFFAVELILGELVGNVLQHAPGPLDIRITWLDRGARLEVIDHGPGYELEPTLPHDAFEESHRGLFLVAAFGADLRVERRRDVTVTSVTLPIHRNE